jgi:hypothetical protein
MPIDPLDLLSEMQREEVQHALADPAAKERLIVTTLVQLRDAEQVCMAECKPGFERRISRLERWLWKALTLWALLAGLGSAGAVAWGLLK